MEVFQNSINHKTKILILNNAHNPTGKLFTRTEIEAISAILDEYPDITVLSDDVYEFLTYDHSDYTFFASVGNNWHRTVTVFSGGKVFTATGWKVGWAIGPADYIKQALQMHFITVFCVNAPA